MLRLPRSSRVRGSAPAVERSRRGTSMLLGALVLSGLVGSGCGRTHEPTPAPAPAPSADAARDGGTFRMVQIAPSTLDPARVFDSYDAALVNQIYDGLLQHDSNFSVRPSVARTWQISEDGRTYRFVLHSDVRFHDGTTVTVRDVAFSIERVFRLDPESTMLARSYLGVIAGAKAFARGEADSISGVRVVDDDEIEFVLEEPYAPFLNVLASEFARIVPRRYLLDHGDDVLERAPVGCGPFSLVRWKDGAQIVLARFDDYHDTPAHVDSLVFFTPPDPVLPHALSAFRRGLVHAVELTTGDREVLESVRGAEVHRRRELSLTFVGLNTTSEIFRDVRVRRAVGHAIDVDSIAHLDAPSRAPATGVLPPGFPGFTPEPKRLAHDPALARALLSETGHPDGSGLPEIVVALPRRTSNDDALIGALCEQWARVGLRARPQYFEWEAFDRGLREGTFPAFLITWVADLPDPDSFFHPLLHTGGSANYVAYADPEVDAALDEARIENDRGRRIDLYRHIEREVLADAVLLPVHFSSTIFAVQPAVRGFEVSSMGGSDLPLHRVWFESEGKPAEVAR